MWKSAISQPTPQGKKNIAIPKQNDDDDDWETDPDFINNVTEEEQRWGSNTVEGSGRTAGAIDMAALRRETEEADKKKKEEQFLSGPNASYGYGGKFGVEKDRMDQSAMGHDYLAKLEQHESQKDYSVGFGGKYGVQTDRQDKSAESWDYKEKVEIHASQKDHSAGFGGKFGVQSDRQDKSALGWDHIEKVDKHISQKDYSVGFGGKFGVQSDRQDKSAVGWDHIEKLQMHESQIDHKVGFGGKFGVQTDRMDKSALAYSNSNEPAKDTRIKPDIAEAKPAELRAKFERMSSNSSSVDSSGGLIKKDVEKKLDSSKFDMFNKKTETVRLAAATTNAPRGNIAAQFLQRTATEERSSNSSAIAKEIEELKKQETIIVENTPTEELEEKVKKEVKKVVKKVEVREDAIYDSVEENLNQPDEEITEEALIDTGLTAVALYDYQAGAADEISFDPDDIITHVETIDEGWWRGLCKGQYGLFPANYVHLQQ